MHHPNLHLHTHHNPASQTLLKHTSLRLRARAHSSQARKQISEMLDEQVKALETIKQKKSKNENIGVSAAVRAEGKGNFAARQEIAGRKTEGKAKDTAGLQHMDHLGRKIDLRSKDYARVLRDMGREREEKKGKGREKEEETEEKMEMETEIENMQVSEKDKGKGFEVEEREVLVQ